MSLTDEQRTQIRTRLLNQQRSLLGNTLASGVQLETRGDAYDLASQLETLERWERLAARDMALLRRIQQTLKHLEREDYGVCKDCDEAIRFERLLVRPTAQLCILCQEDREARRPRVR